MNRNQSSNQSSGIRRLLTPNDLKSLANLGLGSRFTVEGNIQGIHRSPNRGFNVEFADYRQYTPGDDLKRLDWKAFARNERLYIRQSEEESNLRLYLLVDGSNSMAFNGLEKSKYNLACRMAVALAYVAIQQQDSVGLTLFNTEVTNELAPRSGWRQLRLIADAMLEHNPRKSTDLAATLHRLANRLQRRALIVIISDLFDELEEINKALSHFRRRQHDVIVYHTLDSTEIKLPFTQARTFRDVETGKNIIAEPQEIKKAYDNAVQEFLLDCRRNCARLNVDYHLLTTDDSPVEAARQHLARRSKA